MLMPFGQSFTMRTEQGLSFPKGERHSEETRVKMSKAHRGRTHPWGAFGNKNWKTGLIQHAEQYGKAHKHERWKMIDLLALALPNSIRYRNAQGEELVI